MDHLALHPEATSDPRTVLWVLPDGVLPPGQATVGRVPQPLAAWLADGRVASLSTDARGLLVTLAEGRSWRTDGPALRDDLVAALADTSAWAVGAVEPVDDDELRALAEEVLATEIAPLASSHGGRVELIDVVDGEVRVGMHGACHGCPASEATLGERFETALREREPRARVRQVSAPVTISLSSLLRR